jgi:hypothetical protein
MRCMFERFESGWVGVSLSLRPDEIDSLILQLESLKKGTKSHFHFRATSFSEKEGLADVEFSRQGESEVDNMAIG